MKMHPTYNCILMLATLHCACVCVKSGGLRIHCVDLVQGVFVGCKNIFLLYRLVSDWNLSGVDMKRTVRCRTLLQLDLGDVLMVVINKFRGLNVLLQVSVIFV